MYKMLKNEEFFALFTCDEYKSHNSLDLKGVMTKEFLIDFIKKNSNSEDSLFIFDNLEDIECMTIRDINTSLEFGYIEELYINEVL